MIGDEQIISFAERKIKSKILRLLTPTDCVKDRLAAYIHWKDMQGLEQAVLVAKAQAVNLKSIEKFCREEGNKEAFDDFLERHK